MPKKVFRAMYALNYIAQAGFSMVCPAGLLIALGWLLTERCGFGRWAMVVSIILGVLIGFYSMFYYIIKTIRHIDPTEKEAQHGRKIE